MLCARSCDSQTICLVIVTEPGRGRRRWCQQCRVRPKARFSERVTSLVLSTRTPLAVRTTARGWKKKQDGGIPGQRYVDCSTPRAVSVALFSSFPFNSLYPPKDAASRSKVLHCHILYHFPPCLASVCLFSNGFLRTRSSLFLTSTLRSGFPSLLCLVQTEGRRPIHCHTLPRILALHPRPCWVLALTTQCDRPEDYKDHHGTQNFRLGASSTCYHYLPLVFRLS